MTPVVTIDSAVTPTVTCLLWVSASEDFQYSNFSGEIPAEALASFEIAPTSESQIQTSIQEVFSAPFDPIIDSVVAVEGGLATSEAYSGLVDLGKRYATNYLIAENINDPLYIETFLWSNMMLRPGATEIKYFQQWLLAAHVNFRGSVRYKVFWDSTYVSAVPIPQAYGNREVNALQVLRANPTFITSESDSNRFMEFAAVWNFNYPFTYRKTTSTRAEYGLDTSVVLPVKYTDTVTPLGFVGFALGDDFAVGVAQALPLVQYNNPPLLLEEKSAVKRWTNK